MRSRPASRPRRSSEDRILRCTSQSRLRPVRTGSGPDGFRCSPVPPGQPARPGPADSPASSARREHPHSGADSPPPRSSRSLLRKNDPHRRHAVAAYSSPMERDSHKSNRDAPAESRPVVGETARPAGSPARAASEPSAVLSRLYVGSRRITRLARNPPRGPAPAVCSSLCPAVSPPSQRSRDILGHLREMN